MPRQLARVDLDRVLAALDRHAHAKALGIDQVGLGGQAHQLNLVPAEQQLGGQQRPVGRAHDQDVVSRRHSEPAPVASGRRAGAPAAGRPSRPGNAMRAAAMQSGRPCMHGLDEAPGSRPVARLPCRRRCATRCTTVKVRSCLAGARQAAARDAGCFPLFGPQEPPPEPAAGAAAALREAVLGTRSGTLEGAGAAGAGRGLPAAFLGAAALRGLRLLGGLLCAPRSSCAHQRASSCAPERLSLLSRFFVFDFASPSSP